MSPRYDVLTIHPDMVRPFLEQSILGRAADAGHIEIGVHDIREHARASRVDLTLDYRDPDRVTLAVKDNGVGMESTDIGTDIGTDNGGFGLLGVRERVQLLEGVVHVETGPGQGFSLAIEIPG